MSNTPSSPDRRRAPIAAVFAVGIGVAIVAAIAFWVFAGANTKSYRSATESMAPTIARGERFLANKDAADEIRVGDIVAFHPPAGAEAQECGNPSAGLGRPCDRPTAGQSSKTFVKRIVAGPGDRLAIKDGRAIVNDRAEPRAAIRPCARGDEAEICDYPEAITIPAGHWYVLGDVRDNSDDSRLWGPVPQDAIVGRVDDCTLRRLSCEPRR